MAEGRQEVCTSDGAVSRINEKTIIDFLIESDFDLSSLSEEASDEEDENDISIDSDTEEEILLEELLKDIDNIDNNNSIIDEEICEAPEAFVESSRKRLASTSREGQKKKNPTYNYEAVKWQKELLIGGMKRSFFTGVLGISALFTQQRTQLYIKYNNNF